MIDTAAQLARLEAIEGPRLAVFDADGTLWRGDVSEDFTRWMIERGHFDGALWKNYETVNAADPGAGCLEILEFYAGREIARVREHVHEFWSAVPDRLWIPRVITTLRWLDDHGFRVLVVSGTPALVLEPLSHYLPVDPADILGIELEVDHAGRATGRSAGTPTFGPGKAHRLVAHTTDPVHFAAGNSALDAELMHTSRTLAWAIEPDPALRTLAERNGWWIPDDEDPSS